MQPYNKNLKYNARQLRNNMTEAERNSGYDCVKNKSWAYSFIGKSLF